VVHHLADDEVDFQVDEVEVDEVEEVGSFTLFSRKNEKNLIIYSVIMYHIPCLKLYSSKRL
jgi:hypothetical protein